MTICISAAVQRLPYELTEPSEGERIKSHDLLPRCTNARLDHDIAWFGHELKAEADALIDAYRQHGMRVLAIAVKNVPARWLLLPITPLAAPLRLAAPPITYLLWLVAVTTTYAAAPS